MKRVLQIAFVVVFAAALSSAAAVTLGTFAVNPQSTFLYQSPNDVNAGALLISLTCPQGVTTNCVNAPSGTVLQLIGIGLACYSAGGCPPELDGTLGGIFSSNNVLMASQNLPQGSVNRVPGSMNANAPNNLVFHNQFLNTYYGNVDTTIPFDFYIPNVSGITLTVPNGATYLMVGVLDSFFADNSDASHTLAIQINQLATPEPATLGFIALGLVGLGLWRMRRSNPA